MSNPILNQQVNTPPETPKPIPKSKLMWTGAIIAVVGVISPKLADWMNANQVVIDQVVMVGGGFLVMLFRRYTTQPVQGFVKKD